MTPALEAIARDLGLDTLENSGYYEDITVSKTRLREALEAAYRTGERSGKVPRADVQVEERRGMQHGLYVLQWKSGGASLASVGYDKSGRNWFAATNWIAVPWFDWSEVECAEPILLEGDWRRAEADQEGSEP